MDQNIKVPQKIGVDPGVDNEGIGPSQADVQPLKDLAHLGEKTLVGRASSSGREIAAVRLCPGRDIP